MSTFRSTGSAECFQLVQRLLLPRKVPLPLLTGIRVKKQATINASGLAAHVACDVGAHRWAPDANAFDILSSSL